jgi:hypothetical protein
MVNRKWKVRSNTQGPIARWQAGCAKYDKDQRHSPAVQRVVLALPIHDLRFTI